jgi:hypothetical protein
LDIAQTLAIIQELKAIFTPTQALHDQNNHQDIQNKSIPEKRAIQHWHR